MIGIIGAGNMGSGIAQKYATEGFNVVLVDLDEAGLFRGRQKIETTLQEGVERKVFSEQKRQDILSKLTFSTDFNALKDATLVVEAVFEDKEVKKQLFTKLDAICSRSTIFATNTSSFYVADLAAATKRPDRFVGLHYFYHPAKNKLVEVIKGTHTSVETFEKAWQIQEQIGKIPVESKDAPGFIVNRFFVPWLNEAMRIVHEGVADIATVEASAKQAFNIGMGPFELMNVTGVPITLHAATTLEKELGAFYKPCELILPVVANSTQWDLSGEPDESRFSAVSSRLLGVVFDVARQLVKVEKVCTLEDCDLGARVGLRWKKGPFELLSEHDPSQKSLAPNFVSTNVDDNIGYLTLNRPDALNALNETVVAQLERAFAELNSTPGLRGIIIQARGKAFVAGADTHFFVEQIEKNNVTRIVDFAARAQRVFRQIDTFAKPVVCCVDGLALGGGLELALACDYIVASPKAAFGFPETGIGIYPGLGGTQRTPRRVGVELARWLVLSGEIVDAKAAKTIGLVDEVVERSELISCARALVKGGQTRNEALPNVRLSNGFGEIATTYQEPLQTLRQNVKKIQFKAPLALAIADELIRATVHASIEKGLQSELAGLSQIFKTKDAWIGLTSIGKTRPVFSGE